MKTVLIAKTRWFPLSTARVRVCLHCGIPFISTSPGERQCKDCWKSEKGARERAATTPDTTALREAVGEIFDSRLDVWHKSQWVRYYNVRRHAERNVNGLPPDEVISIVRHCNRMMQKFM